MRPVCRRKHFLIISLLVVILIIWLAIKTLMPPLLDMSSFRATASGERALQTPTVTLPSHSEQTTGKGDHPGHVNQKKKVPSTNQSGSVPAAAAAAVFASNSANVIVEVENEVAIRLTRKMRVLVWVMTSPQSRDRALAVNVTWGRRVSPDILLFFSSKPDPSLHVTIALNVSEGRGHLTSKTMQAFDYVHQHYIRQADFFMKVDDDAYVVMENLRYFLSHQDPDQAFVTGCRFTLHTEGPKQGYPSGGGGYVLSRAALARFANRKAGQCDKDGGFEDVNLGKCMETLGVPFLNSSDAKGGTRFHPYPLLGHVVKGVGKKNAYWFADGVRTGPEWINEYPITFHYVKPDDMKMMDFFLYRIRPYGINHKYM